MKKTTIILMIFILAAIISVGCTPKSTSDITFVLDWTPNTNHTGVYVALENGYFADKGLNVEIIQPSEGTAEQLVAANTAQFGISYQENVTFARAQGIPVVSVAAVIQHNTSGFMSLKSEGIMSPADFSGKKYGGWGSDIETAMVKYLMEQSGGDSNTVEIVTIGDTDFFVASATGAVDFAWVYEAWTLKEAELKGMDVNYFGIAEFSDVLDFYTPVIITNEENISSNKKMVKDFMSAVAKGYEYAIKNPDKAAAILLKHAPELDKDLVEASQRFLMDKYQGDAEKWGIQKTETWDRYTGWLFDNGFIEEIVKSEEAFTNAFIN